MASRAGEPGAGPFSAVVAIVIAIESGNGEARGRIARGPRTRCLAQLGQRNGDVLVPPVHADGALGAGRSGRELVEVRLLELLAVLEERLAVVRLERAREDV